MMPAAKQNGRSTAPAKNDTRRLCGLVPPKKGCGTRREMGPKRGGVDASALASVIYVFCICISIKRVRYDV